jgi:hypothetical protein
VVTGAIPNGSTVLVSYRVQNQGDGSYDTNENFFRFRYQLLNQLLAVYGHLRVVDHTGGEQFTLEDLVETVLGVESTWKWVSVGAEYENYDSSLLPSETFRFFQTILVNPSWRSSLYFSAEQSITKYLDSNDEVRRFYQNFTYRNQLTRRLNVLLEGGISVERGENNPTFDRDLLAVNAEMNYTIGKTYFTALYEFLNDDYLNDTRRRQTVYLRVRRRF